MVMVCSTVPSQFSYLMPMITFYCMNVVRRNLYGQDFGPIVVVVTPDGVRIFYLQQKRRLFEELGVRGSFRYVYQFDYQAQYLDVGSENEKCSVFLARINSGEKLDIDPSEISEINWMTLDEIDCWVSRETDCFTPWFLLEWSALRGEYRNLVSDFLNS